MSSGAMGFPSQLHDIEYAIRRNINPETASPYAYVLYILEGASDSIRGKARTSTASESVQ